MRILGVDPGTRVCGWCVLDGESPLAYDVIRLGNGNMAERMAVLYGQVKWLIAKYYSRERLMWMAIETAFVGRYAQAALKLGGAREVIKLAASEAGIAIAEYTPTQVKRAVCKGNADKSQVAFMVRQILGLQDVEFDSLDVTDALAVAICHSHRMRVLV